MRYLESNPTGADEPAATVCRGVNLTETPGRLTPFGQRIEIVEKWFVHNCIMLTSSGLDPVNIVSWPS